MYGVCDARTGTSSSLRRGVLPVYAQMRPGAAAALAAAVGVGVGFTNTGAATGYFLKWGTVWGNFPYFALGTATTEQHYRAVRDVGAAGRGAAMGVTLAALVTLWWLGCVHSSVHTTG